MEKFWQTGPTQLLYRVMPHLFLEMMRKYFRLQIEGLANLPAHGAAILTPNHSGYSGFDALLLSHEIQKAVGRMPQVLTHPLWFATPPTARMAQSFGFIEANMANGLKHLDDGDLVVLFPEGEYGNFKPTSKRYHLQEFKRGFIRMALRKQCPIIPTLIIGAEETHINLSQLKLSRYLPGLVLPLPLNIVPLPARWKMRFLPAINLPYQADAADDTELVQELAQDLREKMQAALSEELSQRSSIYL